MDDAETEKMNVLAVLDDGGWIDSMFHTTTDTDLNQTEQPMETEEHLAEQRRSQLR